VYWDALQAAKELGVDHYDATYHRIEAGVDEHPAWFQLLSVTDETRLERTLELGRRLIDLDAIATGPSDAIGLGPGFQAHGHLLWFLQELGRFPGRGWDFIAVGLASPSIQNRNRSLRTLQEWPRDSWPDGAEGALQAAIDAEVVSKVRRYATDVLRGDVPVDESWRRAVDDLAKWPELAGLARRLATAETGRRFRAQGTTMSLAVWDGPYDSVPWDGVNVTVSHHDDGFTVTLGEGRGSPVDTTGGLTETEALDRIDGMLRRFAD
jgi:hypothetical protein